MPSSEDFESKLAVGPWALAVAGVVVWFLSSAFIFVVFRGILPQREWQDVYGVAEKSVLAVWLFFFIRYLGIDVFKTLRGWWRSRGEHLRVILRYFGVYAGSTAAVVISLALIFLLLVKTGYVDYSAIVELAEETDPADKATRLKLLLNTSTPRFLLSLSAACLLSPLIEEIFFRRFLYVALRKKMGFAPALLISTAGFMSVHPNVALGAMGGLYLGYVYEKGKSLPANIIIHALVNLIVTAISLLM